MQSQFHPSCSAGPERTVFRFSTSNASCEEISGDPLWAHVVVDTFYHLPTDKGCRARARPHILTHFHADHYGGLSSHWEGGLIWCTYETAQLAQKMLGVRQSAFRYLRVGVGLEISPGVTATALDAAHCPGAVMVLLDTPDGRVLHTGDFRLCDDMRGVLQSLRGSIETMYLDNTYCNPKYTFPPQSEVLADVSEIVSNIAKSGSEEGSVLVLVGSYTIGKEKVALALARALGVRVHCEPSKAAVLSCLTLYDDLSFAVWGQSAESLGGVGPYVLMCPMNGLEYNKIQAALSGEGLLRLVDGEINLNDFSHVVLVQPTGWSRQTAVRTLSFPQPTKTVFTRLDVPYSEHCSFEEIRESIGHLRPRKIVPFVNPRCFQTHRMKLLVDTLPRQRKLTEYLPKKRDRENESLSSQHGSASHGEVLEILDSD
eukprot:PhM_4_TR17060/c0_g1_i2/m.30821/K15340/DCLRE1A, SNM1A, PSO2; DNA cross-link repair 1A protein